MRTENPRRFYVTVIGRPAPQGSKRHVGGGRMIEASKKVKPWRKAVTAAIKDKGFEQQLRGALLVKVTFFFECPKSVKDKHPITRWSGDIDKLLRSTFDAMTDSGLIEDDSRIVIVQASKSYFFPEDQMMSEGCLLDVVEVLA